MLILRFVAWTFPVFMMVLSVGGAYGQSYPSKTVRIVTAGVGGGGDFASRQIAQAISGPLGQQVIVDNRGGGIAPGEAVAKAAPDGYTLLVHGPTFWVGALLQSTPYNVEKDFAPITLIMRQSLLLVVHPSLPVKSVKELIALAKAKPGALNAATGPTGGLSHFAAELFKSMVGVNIVRVPYKDSSVLMGDLLGGQVHLTFDSANTLEPLVKSGKLRGIAVTTAEPYPLAPGLPTVAASGLAGFEMVQNSGMFAPARTPEAIINRINEESVRFLKTAEARDRFFKAGVEPVGSTPEQFGAAIKAETARLGKVIKEAGIKAD